MREISKQIDWYTENVMGIKKVRSTLRGFVVLVMGGYLLGMLILLMINNIHI